VHGGEDFNGAASEGRGFGGELSGAPDGIGEEFNFIAAHFLNACAADGLFGGGEDFDAGAVAELESFAGDSAIELIGEGGGDPEAEAVVHFFGLLFGAGEDADLSGGFEEEIQESGGGADGGFAAAAAGPDDGVSLMELAAFKEDMVDVIEGRRVAGAGARVGELEAGEGGEPELEEAAIGGFLKTEALAELEKAKPF
jgi:hypothetical protein